MDRRKPVPADYARLEQPYALCSAVDGAIAYAVSFWKDTAYESRIEWIENGRLTALAAGKKRFTAGVHPGRSGNFVPVGRENRPV